MGRRAIVLMNLGAPDRLEAVRPFLYNLFSDRSIIDLPEVLRRPIAWEIARRRAPIARHIYAQIGGSSPLLANTQAQARALEAELGGEARCFVAMRYWHPFSLETAREVAQWRPDEIVCLPLYPQYSKTTTASSQAAWHRAASSCGLAVPTRDICCYPTAPGFIAALAAAIGPVLAQAQAGDGMPPRLLFSAHGLPKRIIDRGDPYQAQVERTVAAIVAELSRLDCALGERGVGWQVCYQSRVGPLEWIGPSVDAEIKRAGSERVPLVVAPVAFVSEHSETLVELDIEYRRLAQSCGVPDYRRVPAVGTAAPFIAALASLVRGSPIGGCPAGWAGGCGRRTSGA
jgi:ferrochelatase